MPGKKISKEVRQSIHQLHDQGKSVTEIYEFLKAQNLQISRRSVDYITKEERNLGNVSFVASMENDDSFETRFDTDQLTQSLQKQNVANADADAEDTKENNIRPPSIKVNETTEAYATPDALETMAIIKDAVKQETQKVLSMFSKEINHSNDKLDIIIKDVKRNCNKPISMTRPQGPPSTHACRQRPIDVTILSDSEKWARRDLIIKIRNYVDLFQDHPSIIEICGSDLAAFKQELYDKDTQMLHAISEEVVIGINQSNEFESFMNIFGTGLKSLEFVSNILLGINLSGLKNEVLDMISETDLKQLCAELSLSRYVSPQKRILLVTLNVLLKKILSEANLISFNTELKTKLYNYYKVINGYLTRG